MLSPVTPYDVKDMEKHGWKDAEGRTLSELQDWRKWTDADGNTHKIPDPTKGFGKDVQEKIQKPTTETGGVGKGNKADNSPEEKGSPSGIPKQPGVEPKEITPEKKRIINDLTNNGQLSIPNSAVTSSDRFIRREYSSGINQLRKETETLLSEFPSQLLELISKESGVKIEIIPYADVQDSAKTEAIRETIIGKYNPHTKTASVNIKAVFDNQGIFEEEITHLLDHLLGDDPPSQKRFSDGDARSEKLTDVARQLNLLYNKSDLPYIEKHINDSREYLAQGGVRKYLKDPDYLKEKDFNLFEFIRDIFLNEKFWEENL